MALREYIPESCPLVTLDMGTPYLAIGTSRLCHRAFAYYRLAACRIVDWAGCWLGWLCVLGNTLGAVAERFCPSYIFRQVKTGLVPCVSPIFDVFGEIVVGAVG